MGKLEKLFTQLKIKQILIKDHQIIVATIVSNIEKTGYAPVTTQSVSSWCNIDFVDEVMIIDGISDDQTVNILSFHEKCKIIQNDSKWNINEWTWEIVNSMENRIIFETNKIENENKILIIVSSDNVFTSNSILDLKNACVKLIDSKEYDFINYPFVKAITSDFISAKYSQLPDWHVCSINKFNNKIKWGKVGLNEIGIETNRKINQLRYDFKHVPISYDMFCFSRKNIEDKINRHVDFLNKKKPSIDEYVHNWLKKLKRIGISKIEKDQHPPEAIEFIEKITKEHFGYDLFGHKII